MKGHTSGPWERDGIDKWPIVIQTAYVFRPHGQLTIATVAPQGLETEANGALIAAAPDLLAFVRRYTLEAEASGGWPGDDDLFEDGIELIAKAEGK